MAAWGSFRVLRMVVWYFPIWFVMKAVYEELTHYKYPTAYGLLPVVNRAQWHAGNLRVFPTDKTFTTRLRNVEWGHEHLNIEAFVPRMNPNAETFPRGTRMNWVTFQVKLLIF